MDAAMLLGNNLIASSKATQETQRCMIKHRTIRYLSGKLARRGYDGQALIPANLFSDATFVRRLSYKASESGIAGRSELPRTIAEAPPEVAFFLDIRGI
jgi:hypothetical protein